MAWFMEGNSSSHNRVVYGRELPHRDNRVVYGRELPPPHNWVVYVRN